MSEFRIKSYTSKGKRWHQAQIRWCYCWFNLIDGRKPRFANRKAVYDNYQECFEYIELSKKEFADNKTTTTKV